MAVSDNTSMTTLSYLEWINIIRDGIIRINQNRIVVMQKDKLSDTEIKQLFDCMPDISYVDDSSYIVAELNAKYKSSVKKIDKNTIYLQLSQINNFYPLTDRGYRALFSDAEKANIHLEKPFLEDNWQTWSKLEQDKRDQNRGVNLVKIIFGKTTGNYQDCLPDEVKEQLLNDISNISISEPGTDKPGLYILQKSVSLVKKEIVEYETIKDKLNDSIKHSPEFHAFYTQNKFNLPVFCDTSFLEKFLELRNIISKTNK
ncbi:MAG: hypothetical protein LBD17_00660, partial [Endomicrobium sp.]|nr:hypothetical protein [Endomicrobium sp.]